MAVSVSEAETGRGLPIAAEPARKTDSAQQAGIHALFISFLSKIQNPQVRQSDKTDI
jgi:hypothetical protein